MVQDAGEAKIGKEVRNTDAECPATESRHSSGLPQAGTLVVAPTSLLRQWQSEIETKVCMQRCFVRMHHCVKEPRAHEML
jgi:hypothetical protein